MVFIKDIKFSEPKNTKKVLSKFVKLFCDVQTPAPSLSF